MELLNSPYSQEQAQGGSPVLHPRHVNLESERVEDLKDFLLPLLPQTITLLG